MTFSLRSFSFRRIIKLLPSVIVVVAVGTANYAIDEV